MFNMTPFCFLSDIYNLWEIQTVQGVLDTDNVFSYLKCECVCACAVVVLIGRGGVKEKRSTKVEVRYFALRIK